MERLLYNSATERRATMELRVLRYFLAVAREENITAAAETLHVTQPTLSKQLMDLEAELGKTLLIRGNRKIKLTEDGMFLRKRAQEIIELADKTEASFKSEDEFISGEVYIGGGETDAFRYIAKTLLRMRENHPQIHFHIYSGNGEDVTERLDKGLIDFGLFVGSTELKKYDFLTLPASDTWGLLMRRDNPLAKRSSISPQDLLNIPLLCSRQSLLQNELAGWLGYTPEKLQIIGTYNLIYNASIIVEEGICSAITIDGLINTDESCLCFRPFKPGMSAPLSIAWKKYQVFSKAAGTFLETLQQELRRQSHET